MAWFMDADKVLADIETLKKSAWYEFGKKPEQSIAHNWYLSREEAVDKVRELCIKAENVVDAEPVRHGRWNKIKYPDDNYTFWECSVCGYQSEAKAFHNYCPYCGAKMDGGD